MYISHEAVDITERYTTLLLSSFQSSSFRVTFWISPRQIFDQVYQVQINLGKSEAEKIDFSDKCIRFKKETRGLN